MDHQRIISAENEAKRFLNAVRKHRERCATDVDFSRNNHICGYRETGALRRASMDLTRALADMRKP
jgi:hypothetical protein